MISLRNLNLQLHTHFQSRKRISFHSTARFNTAQQHIKLHAVDINSNTHSKILQNNRKHVKLKIHPKPKQTQNIITFSTSSLPVLLRGRVAEHYLVIVEHPVRSCPGQDHGAGGHHQQDDERRRPRGVHGDWPTAGHCHFIYTADRFFRPTTVHSVVLLLLSNFLEFSVCKRVDFLFFFCSWKILVRDTMR